MFSDIHVMQGLFVAICILLALILSLIADRNASDGLTRWALGLCLNACAYIIWDIKDLAQVTHALPLPQMIISFSYVVFLLALHKFFRQPFPFWRKILWPLITFFGCLLLAHTQADVTIFVNIVLFIQMMHLCVLISCTRFHFPSVGRWVTMLGGSIILLINLLRISVALYTEFTSANMQIIWLLTGLEFLMALFSVIISSLGFVWMTRERASAEHRIMRIQNQEIRLFS